MARLFQCWSMYAMGSSTPIAKTPVPSTILMTSRVTALLEELHPLARPSRKQVMSATSSYAHNTHDQKCLRSMVLRGEGLTWLVQKIRGNWTNDDAKQGPNNDFSDVKLQIRSS
jgi:hypothetical protein